MEGPVGMALQPLPDFSMFVSHMVVQDDVHDFARWDIALYGIEKADEFLMPMALHGPPEDLAGHDVQRHE